MFRWLLAARRARSRACAAGAYVAAGRGAPPQLTIDKPDRVVGQAGTLDVTAEAPNARFTALTITLEQNGKRHPALHARRRRRPRPSTRVDRNHLQRLAAARQAERARAAVRAPRASSSPRRGRRFSTCGTLTSTATQGLPGPPRAAAHRRPLDASLRQPRRLRDGRLPGDAARRRLGRARRRRRVPGLPGRRRRRRRRRSGDQGRVLRAALRSAAQHADRRLRARRSGQRGEGDASSTTCSRSRSRRAASRSTTSSSTASCRRSSSTRRS